MSKFPSESHWPETPGSTRSSLFDQIQSSVAFSSPKFGTGDVYLCDPTMNIEPAVNT